MPFISVLATSLGLDLGPNDTLNSHQVCLHRINKAGDFVDLRVLKNFSKNTVMNNSLFII